ncbi:MAG: aspartate/glutamate racemase family protein, partial [Clostridiales bacterium]|nr:aspartate/glutamate racemase family protein [Clostridiales bacterium]
MEKIAILRWESGHVPQGLMQLEQLPGNSTNLASYPFPVKLVEVKGANTDTVILHPSQKLLEDMIQLAKELEKEGVRAITTSCGFNAIFQEALA